MERVQVDPGAGDDPRAHAGPLPQQAEQDVPVADRRGVERDRLAQRQLQDLLRPAAEGEVLGLQPGDDEADAAPSSRLGGRLASSCALLTTGRASLVNRSNIYLSRLSKPDLPAYFLCTA